MKPAERGETDLMDCYNTPIIVERGGKSQLINHSNGYLCGYDPETGAELWHFDRSSTQVVTTTVVWNDTVIVGAGIGDYLRAVRLPSENAVMVPRLEWEEKRIVCDLPSPIICGDYLYLIRKDGIATCREASSGRTRWKKRFPGEYYASITAGDGKIYFCSSDGLTTVVAAGPEYEVLAENALGDTVHASFAISGKRLYIRGSKYLYCVGSGHE